MISTKQRLVRLNAEWDNLKELRKNSPFFDLKEIDDFFLGKVPENIY